MGDTKYFNHVQNTPARNDEQRTKTLITIFRLTIIVLQIRRTSILVSRNIAMQVFQYM